MITHKTQLGRTILVIALSLATACARNPNGLSKSTSPLPTGDPSQDSGSSLDYLDSDSGDVNLGDPTLTKKQTDTLKNGINNDLLSGVKPTTVNGQTTLFPTLGELDYLAPDEMFVFYLYRKFLGRNPEPGGLTFWTNKLRAGGTAAQVIAGILSSPEYYSHFGTDIAWVSSLYYYLLGRAADSGGLAYWLRTLQSGMSRYNVVMGFLTSPEFIKLSQM